MNQVKSLKDIAKKTEEQLFESELQVLRDRDQINNISKLMDWTQFSLAYIRTAELGCDHLLAAQKLEIEDTFLVAAVLYNFKHGLEMMVKMSLKLSEAESQEVGNKQTHDLQALYREAEKIISKKYLKSSGSERLKKLMDKLYILTRKYYYMSIINKYLTNNFSLLDRENTLFKYPENSVGISIDYYSLIEKIDKNDISIIKKDVQRAQEVIYGIFALLSNEKKK